MNLIRTSLTVSGLMFAISGTLNWAMAETPTQSSAERKADLALCRAGRGYASINDRRRLLTESINELSAILPMASNDDQKSQIAQELAQLQDYKTRSDNDSNFWDYGSTCPRQLDFPNSAVSLSTNEGIKEALSRAIRYSDIALCAQGRWGYSMNDRLGFLDSAIKILERFKTKSSQNPLLDHLLPISRQAHADIFSVWNVSTTCPLDTIN